MSFNMRAHYMNRRRRNSLTSFVLAMLLMRAYVPVGFMPAAGTPFLLELCPAAAAAPVSMSMPMDMGMDMPMSAPTSMPVSMPAPAHHHGNSHAHFQTCPFGSAPAAAPISHLIVFAPPAPIGCRTRNDFQSLRQGARCENAHRPRGPPSLV